MRNNNSSRFGKFMQVCFNTVLQIRGCIIEDYLLEQSRVVFQMQDERNYHVFYQLTKGCQSSAEERDRYLVMPANKYHYLTQSGCIDIEDVDDGKDYESLKLAMTVLNITPELQDSIFSIVSAILHIGNLKFKSQNDGEAIGFTDGDMDTLAKVARLLGVDQRKLAKAMSYRMLSVRGQVTEIPLKPKEAVDNRDSASKAIYSRLFTWFVQHINQCTNPGTDTQKFIGVLDIFGFENFRVNSFEQLCINYTNEKLHKFFNHYVFALEQSEYAKEGINIEHIKWVDNQETLDLIEKSPNCILKILDDECRFPKGTDQTYVEKQHKALAVHPFYVLPPETKMKEQFGIAHYAGKVMYDVVNFLDKNKDVQQYQMFDLLDTSSDPLAREITKYRDLTTFMAQRRGSIAARKEGGPKPTVGGAFKDQLSALVDTLAGTQPWYVRCIKPNANKRSNDYNDPMVVDQLRYSGMLDIIRIRKLGYPVKMRGDVFAVRFKCLAGRGATFNLAAPLEFCRQICVAQKIPDKEWAIGKTKVFFKQKAFDPLEERRRTVLTKCAIVCQRIWRGYHARKLFKRKKAAVVVLQRRVRGHMQRIRYRRTRRAIITIQAYTRGWFARDLCRFLKKKKKEEEEAREREHKRRVEQEKAEEARKLAEASRLAEAKARAQEQQAAKAGGAAEGNDAGVDNIFGFLQYSDTDKTVQGFAQELNQELDQIFSDSQKDSDLQKRTEKRWQDYQSKGGQAEEVVPGGDPTFIEYAEKHMNQHPRDEGFMGTLSSLRKRAVKRHTFQEMVEYSKAVFIPDSLTKIEDAETVNIACSAYKDIVRYTRGELKPEQEVKAVQNIVQFAIDRTELRDEIFMQLIKQIIGNPRPDAVTRAWHFLSFCVVALPPSNNLYKHLQAFFEKASGDTENGRCANWCRQTLKRTKLNGARKLPPSEIEIKSIKALKPVICRFFFLDGKAKAVGVDPSATAQDVLTELADKIDLSRTDGWGLYEVYPEYERNIRSVEYICDILASWEVQQRTSATMSEYKTMRRRNSKNARASEPDITQALGGGDAKFVFRKRLFKNPKEIPTDPVEYHLMYAQAVRSVLADEFPTTERVALQLAGLQAQILWGDYDEEKMSRYDDLESYLPERIISNRGITPPRSREGWKLEIADSHRQFGYGKTELQAKVLYLTAVRQYPQYGTTFYKCVYKGFWAHPNNVLLAVDKDGFMFVSAKTRLTLAAYTYAQLQSMDVDMAENTITLTLKPTKKGEEPLHFSFETRQKEDIAQLIASYSPTHRNWSQTDAVKMREFHASDADKSKLYDEVREARSRVVKEVALRKPDSRGSGIMAATLRRLPRAGKAEAMRQIKDQDYEKIFKKEWWSYAKVKLSHSLTVLEQDDEEVALKMFMSILIFGGMSQSGGFESEEDPERTTMVQMVIAKCLEKESLCNEFYLQLIKQTTDHPDPNSTVVCHYWQLMSLTASILVPKSEAIIELLRAHLKRSAFDTNSEESKYAQFVQRALARTIENKNRKYPPCQQEIRCVCARKPIHTRFHFLDGQFRALSFDSAATTQEVVDMVKERIGLKKHVQGFSLFEVFGSLERNMLAGEKVADAMFKWEKYAKSTNSTKQLMLTFKQRLFLGPFITPTDEVEFNLVFHQAIDNVINDRYPVDAKDAAKLAALRAQSELGDYEGPDLAKYSAIVDKHVPKALRQTPGLADEISKEHAKLVGKTKDECSRDYFEFIKEWPLYGATIFDVLQSYTSSLPKNLWLAVNEHGIHILKRREKTPLVTYNYRNIVNYSPSLRNLMIVTESLTRGTKFVFNTSQASQIAHLIRDYTHIIVQRQKRAH